MTKIVLPHVQPPSAHAKPWHGYLKEYSLALAAKWWLLGFGGILAVISFTSAYVDVPRWVWIAAVVVMLALVHFAAWFPVARQRDVQTARADYHRSDSVGVREDFMEFQYVQQAVRSGRSLRRGAGSRALLAINSNVINSTEEVELRVRAEKWFEETYTKLPADYADVFKRESGWRHHDEPPYPSQRPSIKAILHNVEAGIRYLELVLDQMRSRVLAGRGYDSLYGDDVEGDPKK